MLHRSEKEFDKLVEKNRIVPDHFEWFSMDESVALFKEEMVLSAVNDGRTVVGVKSIIDGVERVDYILACLRNKKFESIMYKKI